MPSLLRSLPVRKAALGKQGALIINPLIRESRSEDRHAGYLLFLYLGKGFPVQHAA